MSDVAEFAHWPELAACLSEDPELFFPTSGTARGLLQAFRAKAICLRCPVRQQCLDYAFDTHQVHGIWGGMSENERQIVYAAVRCGELDRSSRRVGLTELAVGST